MKVKIDSEIKEANQEQVVSIIRGFKEGMIDELTIKSKEAEKEITKEKKTLSDKVMSGIGCGDAYREQDVKEAIKEFIDWMCQYISNLPLTQDDVKTKAKEIFGEKLLE